MNNNTNKTNTRCKGKQNNRKMQASKQPFDAEKSQAPTNTAAMYYTSQTLADQLSNISFNHFLGTEEDLGSIESSGLGSTNPAVAMSIMCNPSPGLTDGSASSGVNIAAMKTYTYLSANNAKTTQYAPQDIAMLILAMGEVLSAITVVKRALKFVYTYNMRNRAFPAGIIRAMGFDPSFIADGKFNDVRSALNSAINRFNQVPIIMDNITYLRKCVEMYSDVYCDSDGPMVQYYVINPATTWILDETGSPEGSILKTVPYLDAKGNSSGTNRDIFKFIDRIDEMINALLSSTTYNSIYSDLLRASQNGPINIYKEALLSEDETLLPKYDPMKLLQIHNGFAIGYPLDTPYNKGVTTPKNDVYPDVNRNGVQYLPGFSASSAANAWTGFILDFPHSMGNPDG